MPIQLEAEERSQLATYLASTFHSENRCAILRASLGDLEHHVNQIPDGGSPIKYSELAIEYFCRQAEGPELLRRAFSSLLMREDLKALLTGVLTRTVTPVSLSAADPYNDCTLAMDRVLVGRKVFRQYLRDMGDVNGRRMLLVNGPQFSGKSYGCYLIRHVRDAFRPIRDRCFDTARVEISLDDSCASFDASILARRLLSHLTRWDGKLPPHDDKDAHWCEELATKIIAWFREDAAREWWIVLDGFGHPEIHRLLPTDTHLMIRHLAKLVVAGDAPKVRLVLLNYPLQDLPPDCRKLGLHDNIVPVSQADLTAWLARLGGANGGPADDEHLRAVAADILKGSPQHGAGHFQHIWERLERHCDTLHSGGSAGPTRTLDRIR